MSAERLTSESNATPGSDEASTAVGEAATDRTLLDQIETVGDSNFPVPAIDPMASMISRRKTRKRPRIMLCFAAGWLALMTVFAICAPLLPLKDYAALSPEIKLPPGFRTHEPLGTDHLGRSQMSRVINGAQVSLGVAVGAMILAIIVGSILGLTAGYFRGRIDTVILLLFDAILAFPSLMFLLALVSVLEPTVTTLILGLGVIGTPFIGRIARANTLVVARREYVLAARVMGGKPFRVLSREVLPNILLPVMSFAFVLLATFIIAEGSLSFLGLGVPPPRPSWGGMMASGRQYLSTDPHLLFVPAAMLFLTVFSFNIVGDYVRARVDPRQAAI
jgi:peptide/nickel transport system permease protein